MRSTKQFFSGGTHLIGWTFKNVSEPTSQSKLACWKYAISVVRSFSRSNLPWVRATFDDMMVNETFFSGHEPRPPPSAVAQSFGRSLSSAQPPVSQSQSVAAQLRDCFTLRPYLVGNPIFLVYNPRWL